MNRAGNIFGGYLMKGAYELARSCAYKFVGGTQSLDITTFNIDKHPVFVSSDEISFEYPVSVGSIIKHEAMIACTDMQEYDYYKQIRIKRLKMGENVEQEIDERHCMCIIVRTNIQEPGSCESKLSNLFCFTFVTPGKGVRQVLPSTYEESMIYLYGKRALMQSTQIALRDGTLLSQFL